ncbi:hypothetical protein ACXIT2_15540 [Vibrio parahaemolyticus]
MHKRHDFLESVKRKLRENVANLCSNPDCRALTMAGKTNDNALCNIGVAAHICAAAPGGPRYKSSQSESERKSYDNGIWLCTTCSRLIDADEVAYTEKLLNSWKDSALDYARRSLGKQLLPQDEIDRRAFDKAISHITGDDLFFLSSAPSKVVACLDDRLNSLDSRFSVRTNVIDGVVNSQIQALSSDASFNLSMSKNDSLTFERKLDYMRETGESIRISTESFKVTGSKLFEELFNPIQKGELILQPSTERVNIDLYAMSDSEKVFLGSFKGTQMVLRDGIKFETLAFNKLISITAFFNMTSKECLVTINFNIDTSIWNGKNINRLPFFHKLLMAKDILLSGGGLSIGIDFNGEHTTEVLGLGLQDQKVLNYFQSFGEILNVIDCCKALFNRYSFKESSFGPFHLSEGEYQNLVSMRDLLLGDEITSGESIESITIPVTTNEYKKMMEKKGVKFNDGIDFNLTHRKLLPKIFDLDLSDIKVEIQYYQMKLNARHEDDFVDLIFTSQKSSKRVTRLI